MHVLGTDKKWKGRVARFDGRYITWLKKTKHKFTTTSNPMMTTASTGKYYPTPGAPVPMIDGPILSTPLNQDDMLISKPGGLIAAKYYQVPLCTLDVKDITHISVLSRNKPKVSFPAPRSAKSTLLPSRKRLKNIFVIHTAQSNYFLRFASNERFNLWLFTVTNSMKFFRSVKETKKTTLSTQAIQSMRQAKIYDRLEKLKRQDTEDGRASVITYEDHHSISSDENHQELDRRIGQEPGISDALTQATGLFTNGLKDAVDAAKNYANKSRDKENKPKVPPRKQSMDAIDEDAKDREYLVKLSNGDKSEKKKVILDRKVPAMTIESREALIAALAQHVDSNDNAKENREAKTGKRVSKPTWQRKNSSEKLPSLSVHTSRETLLSNSPRSATSQLTFPEDIPRRPLTSAMRKRYDPPSTPSLATTDSDAEVVVSPSAHKTEIIRVNSVAKRNLSQKGVLGYVRKRSIDKGKTQVDVIMDPEMAAFYHQMVSRLE
jgi:hypothetical protein